MKAHEACGPLEIDSALKTVQTLKSELQDAKMSVIDGQLKPLPGETVSTVTAHTVILQLSELLLVLQMEDLLNDVFGHSAAHTAGEVCSGLGKYI